MKNLNLDNPPNRRGTSTYKWDSCQQEFGQDDLIPLWVADMDFPCPSEVIDELSTRLSHPILGYSVRNQSYYDAISNWLSRRHGWHVEQCDMLFCPPGPIQAINALINLLSNPGDEIIVQTPAYGPLLNLVEGNQRVLIKNPLARTGDNYTFDFDHLGHCITDRTKLLILCSPHNPTGRAWQKDELLSLAKICKANNITVISDEVHCDLLLPGQKHLHFGRITEAIELPSITVISPCKTFNLAGLPQSTLITKSDDIKGKFRQYMDLAQLNLDPPLNVIATTTAYNQGDLWLSHVMEYIDENRSLLKSMLAEALPNILVSRAQATYLAWLDFSALGFSHQQLQQLFINDAKVGLSDGTDFGVENECFFRINLACSKQLLRCALTQLINALRAQKINQLRIDNE